MNILPKDTFLGRLSLFEIYDDFLDLNASLLGMNYNAFI